MEQGFVFLLARNKPVTQNWSEFAEAVETFTEKNEASNITQAGTALGELNNIKNGKDILSMLIIQSGNPIMKTDDRGNLKIALDDKSASGNSSYRSFCEIFQRLFQPQQECLFLEQSLI